MQGQDDKKVERPKTPTQCTLELAEDLLVGNALATLVFLHYLWFLVHFLRIV